MNSNFLHQSVQDGQFDSVVETTNNQPQSETVVTDNYASMSKQELLDELRNSIDTANVESLKVITESIKSAFYKRAKGDYENAKKSFVSDGGVAEEFKMEGDNAENELKELLNQYRVKRDKENEIIVAERAANLAKKYELIERLKALVELSETSSENTYPQFVDIQKEWKEVGIVPKESVNEIWNSYHFQVESYYNIIKINKELRDIDLKKNLELKILLCEEAEKLSLSASVVESFRKLQDLHDKWREIGPVSSDLKDSIWDRFKQASSIVNKNHQQYFEELNAEQEKNLSIKSELCDKVEAILSDVPKSSKDWETATKEVINIQSIWRTIGFAPKKDNNKIYERFKSLCNKFFECKHLFFKELKGKFDHIIQAKIEIAQQARLLKDSEDWAKTTGELIELQKKWKELKGVSSKELDAAWKDFRESCDYFFDRKSNHNKEQESAYKDSIALKEAIIEELNTFEEENPHEAIERLKNIQRRWSESGYVPAKIQNPLYNKYKEIIDAQFNKFKKGLSQLNLDNFKNKVSNSTSKVEMSKERERLQKRLQKLEADVITLENNIGFFSKSSNASLLVKDIEQKIAVAKDEVKMVKEKIKHINIEEKNRNEQ